MPHSDHVLNIFEPRYRQMYSDILFNGSRRFVVPVSHPETGKLASVAPVFYLEDLKEVSEQTADAVKYVCSHKVIGRVTIKRVLNDAVWRDRSTYLKAVVEPLEDVDDGEDLSVREGSLTERFAGIIDKQTKLGEPVRFTENLIETLSAERGEDGLWRLAGLWQSLLQNRLSAKESELSNDIQQLLRKYLQQQGQDVQSKVTVQFDALPAEIRAEFTRLQQTYREESMTMVGQTIYPFVLLVQCDSHAERLNVFGSMLEEEEKRLRAKMSLQSLFANTGMDGAKKKTQDEDEEKA
jgi:Lon protease-like protein